jgi:hypothetical protein
VTVGFRFISGRTVFTDVVPHGIKQLPRNETAMRWRTLGERIFINSEYCRVAAEWLEILLRIQGILDSNLYPVTVNPDCDFSSPSPSGQIPGLNFKLGHKRFLPDPF